MKIAQRIIEKYKGATRDASIFPVPTSKIYNSHINKLIKELEIVAEQKVTFHKARHRLGTIFLTEGGPLDSLSKMTGANNISTTQINAKNFQPKNK